VYSGGKTSYFIRVRGVGDHLGVVLIKVEHRIEPGLLRR
jgi:hypothetical protein